MEPPRCPGKARSLLGYHATRSTATSPRRFGPSRLPDTTRFLGQGDEAARRHARVVEVGEDHHDERGGEGEFSLLLELPSELVDVVLADISLCGLKNLRVTCRHMNDAVKPELERRIEARRDRKAPAKALRQMGHTAESFFRAKALRVMGLSEDDIFKSEIVTPTIVAQVKEKLLCCREYLPLPL